MKQSKHMKQTLEVLLTVGEVLWAQAMGDIKR